MNNTSPTEEVPSKQEGIAICSVFVLEAVLIVVGNLLTIVLFAMNKDLRKKSLYLVINMAFADLVLGALFLPARIYLVGDEYYLWTASVNLPAFYGFFNIVDTAFLQGSLISAALISVERFHAIYWPLKHRTLSKRTYRIAIFMSWTLSTVVSAIFAALTLYVSSKIAVCTMASHFLTLLFIVCGCNIGIWRKYQQRITSQQQNRDLQNKRLTKTLLLVSVVSLLSWLPVIVVNFVRLNILYAITSPIVFYIAVALNFSTAFLNPIVYALKIPEHRQALNLCRFRKQAAMADLELAHERKDNRAVPLTPETLCSHWYPPVQLTTVDTVQDSSL